MKIRFFDGDFAVCKVPDAGGVNLMSDLYFLSQTPDELSLVCHERDVPANASKTDAGWKMFRIEGQLDFGLVGILAGISGALAARGISIFAVSTYDTDYVLIKADKAAEARAALAEAGHEVV